jgi:hypothetical protein
MRIMKPQQYPQIETLTGASILIQGQTHNVCSWGLASSFVQSAIKALIKILKNAHFSSLTAYVNISPYSFRPCRGLADHASHLLSSTPFCPGHPLQVIAQRIYNYTSLLTFHYKL